MIDIHCHIIPNVDDGPKSLEESLDMARAAVSEGITKIIATPHHKNEKYDNCKDTIIEAVDRLNEAILAANIPLTILPGQETRLYGDMIEDYKDNNLLSLCNNGKYLFVELPSNHVPRYTTQLLYDLQLTGLTPIIVHPERNNELIETPDMLYKFVKNGTLTQITTSSLTGHFGKKVKKFTEQLIEHNLVHFLASDAHDLTRRPFRMGEALGEVEKLFGINSVYIFQQNSELLVRGDHIYVDAPERMKKKKFLGIF